MIWVIAFTLVSVASVASSATCGETKALTDSSPSFSFKNPPWGPQGLHDPHANCEWKISAPSTVKEMTLECTLSMAPRGFWGTGPCNEAYLSRTENGVQKNECGNGKRKWTIKGSSTTIKFWANYLRGNDRHKGIDCKISYTPVGAKSVAECGGTKALTDSSPSYSFKNPPWGPSGLHNPKSNCEWKISAPSTVKEMTLECTLSMAGRSHWGRGPCNEAYLSRTENGVQKNECGNGKRKWTIKGSSTLIKFWAYYWRGNDRHKGIDCKISYPAPPCTCGNKGVAPNEYPWQALISIKGGSVLCGGSLIAKQWILTAARCLPQKMPLEMMEGVLGQYDTTKTDAITQKIPVEKVIWHEKFDETSFANNIALVKLKTVPKVSKAVSPVCLPFNYKTVDLTDKVGIATGWGNTKFAKTADISNVLKKIDLKFVPNTKCTSANGYVWNAGDVAANEICGASTVAGKGPAGGDTGGPFVWKNPANNFYFQMGIDSYSSTHDSIKAPKVYAKVQDYVDWIKSKTTSADGLCIKK